MLQKKTEAVAKPIGFYADLEKLLMQQLKQEPSSRDLHLKLLELYFETGRKEDFLRESRNFARGIEDKPASREWQKAATLGRIILPDTDLFREGLSDKIEFVTRGETSTQARARKRFGESQARYFDTLAQEYEAVRRDAKFLSEFDMHLVHAISRPSSLTHAQRLSRAGNGAQIFFKREDLSAGGTHLNIAIAGQALLAQRLGRKTLVTASTNGLRGVLTAAMAARLGLKATIFMDGKDAHVQSSNVFRMWLMGATVESVDPNAYHKGDVRETALMHCARNAECFMVMGLDAAPHPYPTMGVEFASVIGRECKRQLSLQGRRTPNLLVARAGDNADAIGFFHPFLRDASVRLACVETRREFTRKAADKDKARTTKAEDAASEHLVNFQPLNAREQRRAHVIMEGLEYPSVIREHAWLRASGRVEYADISEDAVKQSIGECGRFEGLIPPVETAHAIAWACREARKMDADQSVVVLLRENPDKDIWEIGRAMGVPL